MAIETDMRTMEVETAGMKRSILSWRSILAGLFISFLTMIGLMGLGMAIGGIGLQDGAQLGNAGLFTGLWAIGSILISVFAGSYFAARTVPQSSIRTGAAHGLVIATLFLMFALWQTLAAVTMAGSFASSAVSGAAQMVGQGAQQASQNPWVQTMVEDAIGDMNLRAEPQVVATGVINRLMAGNPDSAKAYLARQSGMTPGEVDQRIAVMQAEVDRRMVEAREAAAGALQATGWTLAVTVLLSVLAAFGGGALAARLNLNKPMTMTTRRQTSFRPATV